MKKTDTQELLNDEKRRAQLILLSRKLFWYSVPFFIVGIYYGIFLLVAGAIILMSFLKYNEAIK